jgi:hypothetical protein
VDELVEVHLVAVPTNAMGGTVDGGAMFATDVPPETLSLYAKAHRRHALPTVLFTVAVVWTRLPEESALTFSATN